MTSHHGIQALVGLGNPGPHYAETRHNAGTWFVQAFCDEQGITIQKEARGFKGFWGEYHQNAQRLRLMIPNVFMNLSGDPVRGFLNFYKIPPKQLLVVHDELDLPLGTLRLKQGGGHGGHNGLRDIINKLGTSDFARLRIGIGRPIHSGQDVADFVLEKPSKNEKEEIMISIKQALACISPLVSGYWELAVQQLHNVDIPINKGRAS